MLGGMPMRDALEAAQAKIDSLEHALADARRAALPRATGDAEGLREQLGETQRARREAEGKLTAVERECDRPRRELANRSASWRAGGGRGGPDGDADDAGGDAHRGATGDGDGDGDGDPPATTRELALMRTLADHNERLGDVQPPRAHAGARVLCTRCSQGGTRVELLARRLQTRDAAADERHVDVFCPRCGATGLERGR